MTDAPLRSVSTLHDGTAEPRRGPASTTTSVAKTDATGEAGSARRMIALDVLRSFALVGIITVNVGPLTRFGHDLPPGSLPTTVAHADGWLQLLVQQRFFPSSPSCSA